MINVSLKRVAYLAPLLLLTQCVDAAKRDVVGNYEEGSGVARLKCTTSLSDNMPSSSSYLLTKSSKSVEQESLDCKAIKNLQIENGGSVRIVIKQINPVIFKGAEVCGRAVWTPPRPSGELVSLYEDLNNRTFQSITLVTKQYIS